MSSFTSGDAVEADDVQVGDSIDQEDLGGAAGWLCSSKAGTEEAAGREGLL